MPTYDSEIVKSIIHESRKYIHEKDNGELTQSELKTKLMKLIEDEVSKDVD